MKLGLFLRMIRPLSNDTVAWQPSLYRVICCTSVTLAFSFAIFLGFHRFAYAESFYEYPYYVGVAKGDITPCSDTMFTAVTCTSSPILVNKPDIRLWNAEKGVAKRVLDPLSVRAIAISMSPDLRIGRGQLIVLVSIDAPVLDAVFVNQIRRAVAASKGLAPEEIMIAITHAHAAPIARLMLLPSDPTAPRGQPDYEYIDGLRQRTIQVIERALDDMRSHPARLMYGHGTSALGFNRRGDDPIATYDQRTDVLQVIDNHERTLAVLFFHGCHPVQMYRTQQIISADYPAVARAEVEAWLKATGSPNAMALFFQGFGGNIDPSPGIWRGDLTEAQYIEDRQNSGRQLAGDVKLVLQSCPGCFAMQSVTGQVGVRSRVIYLPLEGGAALPTELQAVTFENDWGLLAVSHEVVADYATPFRMRAGFLSQDQVTLVGYANGSETYLPTQRMIKVGGYEPKDAFDAYAMPHPVWTDALLLDAVASLVDLPPDIFEPNDTITTAASPVPGEYEVNHHTPLDLDYYAFDVVLSPVTNFTFNVLAADWPVTVTLYNPTGATVGMSSSTVNVPAGAAGRWWVKVQGTQKGRYTFSAGEAVDPVLLGIFVPIAEIPRSIKPGDPPALSYLVDDDRFFVFEYQPSADAVLLAGEDAHLQLFDANGQLLTEGQPDGQQQFREEQIPLTNLTQGAYYVLRVSHLPKNMQALETQEDAIENISTFFISVRTQ